MVRKSDEPINLGPNNTKPTSRGDWARFEIGGERLTCKEIARWSEFPDCSFEWEHIDDIQQGKQEWPNQKYDEYRPEDYETIDLLRDKIKSWCEDYEGAPGYSCFDWQYRLELPELIVEHDSFHKHSGYGPSQRTLRQAKEETDLIMD
eukprot:6692440-Karenia_brevis.AAC.1